jgi:5-hydroxyisourate hydrolase
VLDTSAGRPAAGVPVALYGEGIGAKEPIAESATDPDGRVRALADVPAGVYRLRFDVGEYFAAGGVRTFFPWVEIVFIVEESAHYHVPLLISPFGYSTYRGS